MDRDKNGGGIAPYIRNSINYENIQPLDENLELQWNLSNTDTEGTEKYVRIRWVSIVFAGVSEVAYQRKQ